MSDQQPQQRSAFASGFSGCFGVGFALFAIIVVLFVIGSAMGDGDEKPSSPDDASNRATSESFARIQIGMSISEVESLIGKGELKSREVSPDGVIEEMYTWRKRGGGAFGVAFMNDMVVIAKESTGD